MKGKQRVMKKPIVEMEKAREKKSAEIATKRKQKERKNAHKNLEKS